jgi:hypothetical protein
MAIALGALELLALAAGLFLGALTQPFTFSNQAAGIVAVLSFVGIGTIVAHRRPDVAMGWIMLAVSGLIALSTLGIGYSVFAYRLRHGHIPVGVVALLIEPLWLPSFVMLLLAIVLFPDGQPPSARWRWPLRALGAVAVAWAIATVAQVVHVVIAGKVRVESGGDLYQFDHPRGAWTIVGLLTAVVVGMVALGFVSWLVSQVWQYRRLEGERRVQQKWIISGAVVAGVAMATNLLPYPFSSDDTRVTIADFATIGLAALPVAMGVGILRYRLYDIDRVISRTLSYAILTALLVGTFVGLVVLTTDALPFSSPVGVAASTLAAAALFNPLRVRVQRIVDRRFNRARYDAEHTVAAFASRLRESVDLDAVQVELLDTVNAAMAPTHATIWIRPSGREATGYHSTKLQTPG